MAKSPLKRPAAKPASKTSPRVTTAIGQKPGASKNGASKHAAAKNGTSKAVAASRSAKPVNGKAAAKAPTGRLAAATISVKPAIRAAAAAVTSKLDGAAKLSFGSRASIRAGVARTTIDGKSASTAAAKNVAAPASNGKPTNGKVTNGAKHTTIKLTNGSKPANGSKPTNAATLTNGSKSANATPVAAPVEAPKIPGRPMLMQGPVASKSLTKKGTFVLPKTPAIAPKPVKRKIERPEPAFVTLQPPVAQVRTSEKAVKNRAGLNQRDLDFFRDLLLTKRRELVGDMSHMEREALRESNATISSLPVDITDQGTDAYEQEFTLGLVEKDRTLLREINDAIAKLQNGTYGICEGTGNPISRPRLEAQPWARHSIEFARILEKRKMVFRR